uniref:Secreted protein n=1 Tax=Knipowitschia caucasica TaxID=637954 RepID=A0AAV2K227_KNICA
MRIPVVFTFSLFSAALLSLCDECTLQDAAVRVPDRSTVTLSEAMILNRRAHTTLGPDTSSHTPSTSPSNPALPHIPPSPVFSLLKVTQSDLAH